MNIDQLKSFHQVVVTGSFTRAARELFLTQPAVSQQIQLLEHALGTSLFDRSGKKIRLTEEGKILLSYTERLFNIYDEIEVVFGQLRSLEKGKIIIGSTAVMGTYFLPKLIGRYSRSYPGIEIDVRMGNSHKVTTMLLAGQVDLGFAGRVSTEPRLDSVMIHREKLLMVSSADNPLTGRKSISMDDLKNTPFIWREKGTRTRALVNQWFENRDRRDYSDKWIELHSVEAAKRTVVEGYGVTVVPEISVMRELHLGLLKRIPLEGFDLTFEYYLFSKKGKIPSRAAQALLDVLADFRLLSHPENLHKMISR